MIHPKLIASYRQSVTTGLVTTIAAGTATAGHILALRNPTAGRVICLKSIEAEFILTTAFGAAQEVGFDILIARSYSAAHSGATALTLTGNTGGSQTDQVASALTGRIADTGALTAGTHTLDTNAIAKSSGWFAAVGAQLSPRYYDFTAMPQGGILLTNAEGIVVRNSVLMGATGVGKWHFSFEWEDRSA